MMEDNLDEAAVRDRLDTVWVGRPYTYIERIDSTNERMKLWVLDPAYPSGTVLLTDFQTAGRGRLDRRWEAPPGSSLLLSVLFRPGWPVRRGNWLTMLAGLAVAEAVEEVAGLPAQLKWPNDVVLSRDPGAQVGDDWRKAGGLLLDTTLDTAGERIESAILGIGLNVNIAAVDLPQAITPPVSLLVAGGSPVPRRPLLLALLRRLEHHYDAADHGRSPAGAWSERLITLGRRVEVSSGNATAPLIGTAEATDEWGQLLVRDDTGQLHTVAAGDVTLRRR